jgi:glutathione S-transferase
MTDQIQPIIFYSFPISGHAHRVELLLRALDLPFTRIDVDLSAKEQKSDEFLAKNPFGQVPVIDDEGTVIWDSAAIMVYLCLKYDEGEDFMPRDPVLAAQVTAWLGKAAGPINFGLACARRINIFNAPGDLKAAHALSHEFLQTMDSHLAEHGWLVGYSETIADFACYTYVAHAPEGGIDLSPYHHVNAWIGRVEALPYFAPMRRTPVGLWAATAK